MWVAGSKWHFTIQTYICLRDFKLIVCFFPELFEEIITEIMSEAYHSKSFNLQFYPSEDKMK